MKRLMLFFVILLTNGFAGAVTATVNIQSGSLSINQYHNYDVVTLENGVFITEPGKPFLPLINATMVIPANARVTDVKVEPVASQELKPGLNILPGQLPVPISSKTIPDFVPPDSQIYHSPHPYPAQPLLQYSSGSAGGFRLVGLLLCPFTYYPLTKRLLFHSQLKITITYDSDTAPPVYLTPFQRNQLLRSLKPLVINPVQLTAFAPPIAEADQTEINYLIITSPDLASWLIPYQEYKKSRGLKTEIRTTDWIERNYPGRDLQEKIRNHIIDYFYNRGVTSILLAGDNRQVPSRQIRVYVGNEMGSIPTDLYYGDLDYSWDSNRNNLFGEMADSVDLYADVFVSRASFDNQTQVVNFINKVRAFENSPVSEYIKRSLLPSGWLWRDIGYHGKFVNDSIAEITPYDWVDRKMENPRNARIVADSFDLGFLIFDPAGHGNEAGVYDEDGTPIYTSNFAGNQQNQNRLTVITSLACNPGNFEAEDCLAEIALNCPNAGAIGVMMNSRYGWGTPPAMGPSEKLCVRFYDYLFNRGEFHLGPCHNRSREEYTPSAIYSSLWRWCLTEFNLLGDPTVDIWTDTPLNLSLLAPDTISTGAQTVTVTALVNSRPASGVQITAYKENEVLTSSFTTGNGQATLNIHPFTTGELKITATAHNHLPAVKTITITAGAPEPVLIKTRFEVDDTNQSNPNRILEPGETARLKLTIKNIGTAPATTTRLLIRTSSQQLIIIDSTAIAGTIAPAESALIEDLTINAMPEAFPGSSPEILLTISSDQHQWQYWFFIPIGYPGRVWAEIDTGTCALTITARGTVGYDPAENRAGRGFRYPKSDTSGLYLASFVLGNSPEYIVDRFYNQTGFDQDWLLNDSIRTRLPLWNADQLLQASFCDLAHPRAKNIVVDQRAIGLDQPELSNVVVIVYDIYNFGSEAVNSLYAGIFADFDVIPTDRLHDLAFTVPDLNTAFMRNANANRRYLGIKLLSPNTPAQLTCLDHAIYVYPESAMTEDIKYRALTGALSVPQSNRPFNWSILVSTSPFDLPAPGNRHRVAFAFIAGVDSLNYLNTCRLLQEWYDNNVGIIDNDFPTFVQPVNLTVSPNPFTQTTTLHYHLPFAQRVRITVHDITGRTIATLLDQTQLSGSHQLTWNPHNLAQGIYFLKLQTTKAPVISRIIILR